MTGVVGLPTGTKTKVLGIADDRWLTSVTYYDANYRSILSIAGLYPEGREVVSNAHNFSGDVTETRVKQTMGGQTYGYSKWFEYDASGRLSAIRQQMQGDSEAVTVAAYTYDGLGNLAQTALHNGLETTSHAYDMAGRQTGTSSPSFSYNLWFDRAPNGLAGRNDGRLAHVTWGGGSATEAGYTFSYDGFGQMAAAQALQTAGAAWTVTDAWAEKGTAGMNTPIEYDRNGNIRSLARTDGNGGMVHSLEYRYDDPQNGNALSSLVTNGTPSASFVYDENGNMTTDGLTGVQIEYNLLNLPQRIVAGGEEIRYIYSADGTKLASVQPNGSLTYYRSVFTYTRSALSTPEVLQYVLHPEGLVWNQNGTFVYKYFKRDHVGSTRVLLSAENGGLTVDQRTDYYPFGLAQGRLDNPNLNPYLYGGKEFQDATLNGAVLGLYDFHARYYNPLLGRWFNQDPALQTTNPYLYCANSPMMYVDPDGEFFWIIPNIGWSKSGGLNIGFNFMIGIPGVASVQAGVGYNFKNNDFNATAGATVAFNTVYASYSTQSGFNVGWSAGISPQMGFPISTNFTSIGANYNITHNHWSGNLSAWSINQNSWEFNPSVSTMIYPEHTTNLIRGQGFRSNNRVFRNFVENGQQQKALDYFGFKGTYDPSKTRGNPGLTDPQTGEIFYGDHSFEGNFDRLALTAYHEMRHQRNVLSGKYQGVKIDLEVAGMEEWETYLYSYRNQGLYRKHRINLSNRINWYGNQAGVYGSITTPTGGYTTSFSPQWWHFIYKIPRIW
ncbi:MAG: RHS repeat-associated core domain-containing protein [Culturomica sp.]|nr:RHS repeat-associated core domain-containing protein [Culturomica sp.]